jgi:putative peptide zinc metalloprotease protein
MQKEADKRRKLFKAKKSKYGDLSQITFPAVNPDRFLTWLHGYTSWIYTWWFTCLTLLAFAAMGAITLTHWGEIGRDTLQFFNFTEKSWGDVAYFYLVAVSAMCWHEIGHGHACKHYGGRVPSMGFLLIYLTPAFYTDTGQGQVLASRYQRMVIALAGAWSELYICAVATVIWWASAPDTALHSFAYMMMLITGIASVFINFNPLIKLDGYYIMCELLGIADLKENSTAFLSGWIKSNVWGLPVDVPYVPRRRRAAFAAYAILSGLYSYTVLFVIVRFAGNVFRNFNPDWSFVPEIIVALLVFRSRIRTLVNFMKFVYLDKKDRVREWLSPRRSVAAAAAAALFLLLPLRHESAEGRFVLEAGKTAVVRAAVSGKITEVTAREGMEVEAGEPLARLQNISMESRLAESQANTMVAVHRATSAALHYANYGLLSRESNRLVEQSRNLSAQAAQLQVVGPISGVVLTPRVEDRQGSYATAGAELMEIADLGEMRARIYVSEHDLHYVGVGSPARLSIAGFTKKWDTHVESLSPVATEMDPRLLGENKFQGLRPPNFYVANLTIPNADRSIRPGMVGTARVYGQRRSLAMLVTREVMRFFGRKLW